jgi:hypothetical protein
VLFRPAASSHKTGFEMNAPQLLFATAARFAAFGVGVLLVAGCASPFGSSKIDPTSPVAADVQRLSRSDRPYPKFSDIPAMPKDIRPVAQYGVAAQELAALRDDLVRATAPETWQLTGTEDFANRARQAAPDVPTTERANDPEAFARELRERATPPPPR